MLLRLRQVVTARLYSTEKKPQYLIELIYVQFPEIQKNDSTLRDYDYLRDYMLEKLKDAPLLIPPDKRHSLSDVLAFIKKPPK